MPCTNSFYLHQPRQSYAAFSAAILASIFLRAARIISSLRLCSEACLSSRFELHALVFLSSSVGITIPILFLRLYRVIRSGWTGFSGCRGMAAGMVLLLPGGGGGWKVTGGYMTVSNKVGATAYDNFRVVIATSEGGSGRCNERTMSNRPARIRSVVF